MIIQVRFGSAQTGMGYQFYSAAGTLLGSRITAGIVALPETGSYAADATVPANSVGVFWDTATSQASEDLREALNPEGDNSEVLAAIALLPTEAEILAAAGGITVETAAKLDAADQILLVELHTPSVAPSLIVPLPDADSSMTVCYAYTENIINQKRAGIVFTFRLFEPPAKSERLLEIAPQTATTDSEGFASISLISGVSYRVICPNLGINTSFTPTGETFNLFNL